MRWFSAMKRCAILWNFGRAVPLRSQTLNCCFACTIPDWSPIILDVWYMKLYTPLQAFRSHLRLTGWRTLPLTATHTLPPPTHTHTHTRTHAHTHTRTHTPHTTWICFCQHDPIHVHPLPTNRWTPLFNSSILVRKQKYTSYAANHYNIWGDDFHTAIIIKGLHGMKRSRKIRRNIGLSGFSQNPVETPLSFVLWKYILTRAWWIRLL